MTPAGTARPASVTAAAALFLVYGITAVIVAGVTQGWAGSVEAGSIPRALLRLAAAGVIGWGLMRGAPWSWGIGLGLAILWLIAGLAPVLVLERGDVPMAGAQRDQSSWPRVLASRWRQAPGTPSAGAACPRRANGTS